MRVNFSSSFFSFAFFVYIVLFFITGVLVGLCFFCLPYFFFFFFFFFFSDFEINAAKLNFVIYILIEREFYGTTHCSELSDMFSQSER